MDDLASTNVLVAEIHNDANVSVNVSNDGAVDLTAPPKDTIEELAMAERDVKPEEAASQQEQEQQQEEENLKPVIVEKTENDPESSSEGAQIAAGAVEVIPEPVFEEVIEEQPQQPQVQAEGVVEDRFEFERELSVSSDLPESSSDEESEDEGEKEKPGDEKKAVEKPKDATVKGENGAESSDNDSDSESSSSDESDSER